MNPKKLNYLFIFLMSIFLLAPAGANAKGDKKDKKEGLQKTNDQVTGTFLDINQISTQFVNDGDSDYDPLHGTSGLVYPKGSGKTACFEAGLLWGAYVKGDDQVRVGGSAYRHGLQPGIIKADGTPDDPNADKYSIYRVRPDIYPGGPAVDLGNEANNEGTDAASLRARYEHDWTNWPADLGAPYDDKNGDGKYEPGTDVPGVPGADQTIWFVANDQNAGKTTFLYGAQPLGVEMQATIWAYNQQGALGNMYFRKYKIINKGSQKNELDSMYVSMWADVDDGGAGDDFVGVDTTLSLQYCYNATATDEIYGATTPAIGFDFFQGPAVDSPGDSAIFDGKRVYDKRNLPMTAAYYFANGDANIGDPPQGVVDGSTQFYRFFKGEYGISGQPFVDPISGKTTTFALSGDPQTRTGWLDGKDLPPGDRRQGSASGPFTMMPGDTQEVVVAEIVAGDMPGVDRLAAIGLLKFYDQQAQLAYDNFFNLPTPPPSPSVNAIELSNKIVLDWGENNTAVKATESSNIKGFKFQGYNVYQLPSAGASFSQAVRVATFDVVDGIGKIEDKFFNASTGVVETGVKQFGTDSGIKRYLTITTDAIKGGTPIINGIKYYFAVTAYSFNADPNAVPNNLENPVRIMTIIPHSPNPGVRYGSAPGDTIIATHASGKSDGEVIGIVVDPTSLTGDSYKVTFDSAGTAWSLTDVTKNQVLLANQTNLTGDDNYMTVDGIFLKVKGPDPGFKSGGIVELKYGGAAVKTDVSGAPYGGNNVWHSLNSNATYYLSAGGGDGDFDRLLRYADQLHGRDFEIRFTDGPNYGVKAFTNDSIVSMPFQIWDIGSGTPDDPSDDKQMIPWIYENASGFNSLQFSGDVDPYFGFPASDWVYWLDPVDKDGYNNFAAVCEANGGAGGLYPSGSDGSDNGYFVANYSYPIGRMIFCDYDANAQWMPSGTVIRFVGNKPNTSADQFTFSTPAPTDSKALAVKDVGDVNVFPNPYYGVNSEELNKYNRFVTFSHLPSVATIRIFNLAGVLVRKIDHNSNDQFERWDLNNSNGLPAASGLYIAYIDMPNLGTTKILKLSIIQEQQILDRF